MPVFFILMRNYWPSGNILKNAPLWRRASASYYDIPIAKAKEVLLCALYGYLTPRGKIAESPHTLPFVDWLAQDVGKVRDKICSGNPDFLRYFRDKGRRGPAATLFCYMLAKKEAEILTILRANPLRPGTPYADTDIIYRRFALPTLPIYPVLPTAPNTPVPTGFGEEYETAETAGRVGRDWERVDTRAEP